MPKVVGYVRVSTEDQKANGVSLDAQEAKIKAWHTLYKEDYSDVVIYTDEAISGTVHPSKRPGLQQAISSLSRGDCLVVYSLSRLTRTTADAISLSTTIAKKKADLVSLSERIDTTNASGKMVFRMLAVLSEFERDLISERTSAALQHKKAAGLVYGNNTPYGYKRDLNTLIKDEHEQKIIVKIERLHAAGKNYTKIANHLNQSGITSRCGGKWYPQTVKNILKI